MKVLVGMSGGVDSSVTAYLLMQQGYEVEGVTFVLEERRGGRKETASSCCSLESIVDARKSARRIDIKHRIISLRREFAETVITPFIEAYLKGVTPNPCILCNGRVKFPFLLEAADRAGAEYIATGHYARVEDGRLFKGTDARKDQSYVLYVLKHRESKRLLLPLGGKRKEEVRAIARELGLPSATRPESQEICFVGGRNYVRFLEAAVSGAGGPIVDLESGKVMGRHNGIHRFTIGQRKGLGIATGKPLFVAKIDPAADAVYVSRREAAMIREFTVESLNWLHHDLPSEPSSFRGTVKVRSTMRDEPAEIAVLDENSVRVVFDEPQWAPAPGQSAVFYRGEQVIGGGIIRGFGS